MTFSALVHSRRSIRVFDHTKPLDPDAIKRCIELAILSPNSSNMQLWEFIRVRSVDMMAQVAYTCMNQSAAKTAQELVVLVSRLDLYKERAAFNIEMARKLDNRGPERAEKYYGKQMLLFYNHGKMGLATIVRYAAMQYLRIKKPFMFFWRESDLHTIIHKSNGIAAQTFMLAMRAEGLDTCPMEGFDEPRLKKVLNLPKYSQVSMVIACGHAAENGVYAPRWRVPYKEVVKEV